MLASQSPSHNHTATPPTKTAPPAHASTHQGAGLTFAAALPPPPLPAVGPSPLLKLPILSDDAVRVGVGRLELVSVGNVMSAFDGEAVAASAVVASMGVESTRAEDKDFRERVARLESEA
jgi:hypothetical protein